jgi:hypothetical protein
MVFDFYPPNVTFGSPDTSGCTANGDTVLGRLGVVLGASGVEDKGKARVTKVELIVAQKPAGLAWNYWNWLSDSLVPVTLNELYQQPHELFPYSIAEPLRELRNVKWENISTQGWPSGDYLVGVITGDEFGNEGLGLAFIIQSYSSSNPFLVTILSGS